MTFTTEIYSRHYGATSLDRIEAIAADRVDEVVANNKKAAAILLDAKAALLALGWDHSMTKGYDVADVVSVIAEMVPDTSPSAVERLRLELVENEMNHALENEHV